MLPPRARVMMMGTFPPAAAKRCMAFHYPNFQNDMWRIYGLVFFNDAGHFQVAGEKRFDAGKIRDFLMAHNIALCPTVRRAVRERGNASDKFLRIVEPVDLGAVLTQLPDCRWLFTTGGKATETLLSLLEPAPPMPPLNQAVAFDYHGRHLQLCRLPSSSRAYPLALAAKAAAYRVFFERSGVLPLS